MFERRFAMHVLGGVLFAGALAALAAAATAFASPGASGAGGGLIAFTRCRLPDSCDAGSDIWVMKQDATGLRWITRDGTHNDAPSWSPDGKKIVFVSGRGTSDELWSMNADGSGSVRLTPPGERDEQPAWSPDGRHIAFVRKLSRTSARLELIDAAGGGRKVLTHRFGDYGHPSWSPDSRLLVFSYARDPARSRYGLYTVRLDNGAWRRLGRSGDDYLDPAWSPNGKSIAFSYLFRVGKTYSAHLELMRADGRGQRAIVRARPGTVYFAPSWSPDGERIAFVSLTSKTGLGQIDFVNTNGSAFRSLRQLLGDNRAPAWQAIAASGSGRKQRRAALSETP